MVTNHAHAEFHNVLSEGACLVTKYVADLAEFLVKRRGIESAILHGNGIAVFIVSDAHHFDVKRNHHAGEDLGALECDDA